MSHSQRRRKKRELAALRRLQHQQARAHKDESEAAAMSDELSPGGQGGTVSSSPSRSDLVIEGRAIRNSSVWGLTEEKLTAVGNRQVKIASDPSCPDRIAVSAARNVIAMRSLDMEQEKRDQGLADQCVIITGPDGGPVQHDHHIPVTEQGRLAEAMALLDQARTRSVASPIQTETAGEVLPADANGQAE